MTRPPARLGEHLRSAYRRPGICAARRFAFALATAIAVLACSAGAAAGDQTVLSATIYPASSGAVTYQSVSLSKLGQCPPYTGPNPMYLYPSQQPYQWANGSTGLTWSLAEVLQCGLGILPSDVTEVQVLSPNRGFEATLSSADLTDPSQYQDPQAPGALPVISSDGVEDQNTYFRPYQGGSDNNTDDQVIQTDSPIAVVVYANGPPLSVAVSQKALSQTSAAMRVGFAAEVHGADGSTVPTSALTWNWSFGDGRTSTNSAPTHSFAKGDYFVTVQVTDAGAGLGATDTIEVSAATSATTGAHHRPGGNSKQDSSPSGLLKSSGNLTGGPAKKTGAKPRSGASGKSRSTAQTGTTTTKTPAPDPTSAAAGPRGKSGSSAGHSASTAAHHAAGHGATPVKRSPAAPAKPPRATGASSAPVVTGRLISDVTALPPDASPLVQAVPAPAASAPAVRRAIGTSLLPGLAAGFAVLVLLGLGAGRELRGLRGLRHWSALRLQR